MNKVPTFCKVCRHADQDVIVDRDAKYDRDEITCVRCGHFYVTGSCLAVLGDPTRSTGLLGPEIARAAVGHWLREQQTLGHTPILRSEIAERLAKELRFPSIHDQREALLVLLGTHSDGPGDNVEIDAYDDQYKIGASTPNAIAMLVEQLEIEGLVKAKGMPGRNGGDCFYTRLTAQGWLAFEDIKRGKTTGRKAFMAMPFDKPDLDDEWLPKLRAAVEETGFSLHRVDDAPKPGSIDDQMRFQIKQARFLIVELTHANNGAYWEAGFAEGLGKPVIYSCREDHKAHFDVDHSLRIEWTEATMDKAVKKLKAVIRNAMPDATQSDKEPEGG